VRTFFDSSAFAKRYVEEAGSQAVDAICADATELALSVVCIPEIISAFNRRVREGNLSRQQYIQAKTRLSEDVEDAVIVNLTSSVLSTCTTILEDSPVRAMDALHIACAIAWNAELFVSADKQQIMAADKAGLRTKHVS
jgi:predicted nucleic acid-binding protein